MLALKWLKANNELYLDIDINQDWEISWDNYVNQTEQSRYETSKKKMSRLTLHH